MGIYIKRGDVFFANLDPVVGSEQGGNRPVIVLQNSNENNNCPTLLIAPITSKSTKKTYLCTHCVIESEFLDKGSLVLLEQMRTIDKKRLGRYLGRIDYTQMNTFGKAIKFSTGLIVSKKEKRKNEKQI